MFESENSIQSNVDYITKSYLRNVMQLAIFYTGMDKIYAINISKIQTFLIKDSIQITKTPSADGLVVGVINLRGEMISVVNLDKWIGDEVDENVYKIIVICNYNERKVGVLVKDIIKIEEKNSDELKLPSGNDPKISYITDVEVNNEHKLCIVFDAEKLLFDMNLKDNTTNGTTIYDVSNFTDMPPIYSDKYLLVAEDSRTVIEKLHEFFDGIGIKYEIYENGQLLLDRLEDMNPNNVGLIVTDIEMPVKNGYQVIKYVKESSQYKNLPILSLTSMTNKGVNDKILKLGAIALVNKADLKMLYRYIKLYLEK